MKPWIMVDHLYKKFGNRTVVNDLSFSIGSGQILAFLGPNGAGKSTTIKMILGLLKPTSGIIEILGTPEGRQEKRSFIGYCSQEISYPPHLSVREVLHFVRSHYSHGRPVDELLARFRLEAVAKQRTGGLSGGEQRRLGLACALAGDPSFLILDEPTTGLDLDSRWDLWREVQAFAADGGCVLLSTHDLAEVTQVAHRVLLIEQGKALFEGSLDEILGRINVTRIEMEIAPETELPPLATWTREGQRVHGVSEDPDALIRQLVEQRVPFANLRVEGASLEEAFLHYRELRGEA